MKIAIIGDGQLGTYVFDNFSKKYQTIMYALSNGFDIKNYEHLTTIVENNDVIINCAALTNVDFCELNRLESQMINHIGPKNLAELCFKLNRAFIHISTDYVYGSNELNHNLYEFEYFSNHFDACPINRYGYDKLMADEDILTKFYNSNKQFLIIRPSWVFGKNNPQNFIEKIKNNLLSNKKIKVVMDQYGVPTSVNLIFLIMDEFINKNIPSGLYNLRNEIDDNIIPSRYDIACFIKELIGSKCKIKKCKTSEFILPAKRQLNSFLNIDKIKKVYKNNIPTWKEEIEKYFN